jgi:hypothetical protein
LIRAKSLEAIIFYNDSQQKDRDENPSTRSLRQREAQKHLSQKHIIIRTPLIHSENRDHNIRKKSSATNQLVMELHYMELH